MSTRRSPRRRLSSTVAWINQWADPRELRRWHEFDSYWKGANAAAEQLGYRLEEFVAGRDLSHDRLQKILQARGVRVLNPPRAVEACVDKYLTTAVLEAAGLRATDVDHIFFTTVTGIAVPSLCAGRMRRRFVHRPAAHLAVPGRLADLAPAGRPARPPASWPWPP